MGFSRMGLSDPIMQGVQAAGYTVPTPIQSLAIRPALEGRDIIGLAQTGTGKTAAFVLPLLHLLEAGQKDGERHQHPRALVLTPTRELAQQVHEAVDTYGQFVKLRTIAVYGGVDMDKQLKLLRRGVDVVIATPGRLLDHLQRGSINLSSVQVLVLDEADRMLDMGFIRDVRTIIAAVPADRQTMLFSATMPDEISALAEEVLRNPETVEVGERTNPVDTIEQHFYTAGQEVKTALLLFALEAEKMESVLVFSRTKHGADKIARRLDRGGVATTAIHSNRTQGQRDRALDAFKSGKVKVLVATDIAARGLDVSGISHVVNYDIPHQAEDYIHRIGRTGRAGAAGDAITFVSREDQQFLQRIERHTGRRVQVKSYPGFVPPPPSMHQTGEGHHQPHADSDSRGHFSGHAHTARNGQPASSGSTGNRPGSSSRKQHGSQTRPGSDAQHAPHGHDGSQVQHGSYRGPVSNVPPAMYGRSTSKQQQPASYGYPRPSGGKKISTASGPVKKHSAPANTPWQKNRAQKKKRSPILAVRKKSPPKKLDSFSSHTGGSGWSNY
jgi:ATP-dependent RNA helicase RhlE